MKILTICTGFLMHQQYVYDDAKADAAYEAIKAAISTFDKYGNDKDKTVSVDVGDGEVTFRIETLVSIGVDSCTLAEETIIEREVWKRSLDAKITARLAPATA